MTHTTTTTTTHSRRTTIRRRGFTLTEVLIALALVSFLLIGISRVFSLTSTTIGQGQAMSAMMRTQRTLLEVMDTDLNGTGQVGDIRTGFMPIYAGEHGGTSQPAIVICNFHIAAFDTPEEERTDADFQSLAGTALTNLLQRDTAIRTEDSAGSTVPHYAYGFRNYRIDSLSFFSGGYFERQTPNAMDPASASGGNPWSPEKGYPAPLHSNEAWIWYGHLRLFNSDIANIERTQGYGSPGQAQTENYAGTDVNNRNDLYASQFTIGRMAMVLKEPIDHDGNPNTLPTVVGDANDVQSHTFRLNTNGTTAWLQPTDNIVFKPGNGAGSQVSLYPLAYGAEARIFDANLPNLAYHRSLNTQTPLVAGRIETGRTDVAGVSAKMFHDRIAAIYRAGEDAFAQGQTAQPSGGSAPASSYSTSVADFFNTWHVGMFATSTQRPWGNPYPAMHDDSNGNPIGYTSRDLSQRSNMLAAGCTNFIVEFAGDFGTQQNDGTFTSVQPDGILDFVVMPDNSRAIRWYGMPRDVDGDGHIPGGVGNRQMLTSIDVVPVRDLVGNVLATTGVQRQMPFEKTVPPAAQNNDYLIEPASNTLAWAQSSYVCAWGPQDFDGMYRANGIYYQFAGMKYRPTMLRILLDLRDGTGKISQPITSESVYYLPGH